MVEIIHFSMTASAPLNYVIDIVFTTLLVVTPVKVVYEVFKKGFRR